MKVWQPEDFSGREVQVLFCLQELGEATAMQIHQQTRIPLQAVHPLTKQLSAKKLLKITRPSRKGKGKAGLNPFVFVITPEGKNVGVEE